MGALSSTFYADYYYFTTFSKGHLPVLILSFTITFYLYLIKNCFNIGLY